MYRYSKYNRIFSEGNIREVFNRTLDKIVDNIEKESEDYILNVNQTEYVNHLSNELLLDTPSILFENVYADVYEDDISTNDLPFHFNRGSNETIRKEIIQFFLPVEGNISLLKYSPASSISISSGGNFTIASQTIVAEFINFYNDAEKIKKNYDDEVNGIRRNYSTLISDIKNFNDSIKSLINKELSKRKSKLLKKNNLMSSLGVPLKNKSSISKTFSIPQPKIRKKLQINKPLVNEKGYKPEPTLSKDDYLHILKLINDVGKNFERLPSTYKDKGEEDLRDHILITLDPNFELGSASGETFNKSGKTDIQLRYDSSVVFIAECKFWTGEKGYLKTISQLLNYLTWRDTKASVIIFVRQKDFTSILTKVKISTKSHSNYLGYVNNNDENWFNYRFHINGDQNREIKLAIQLYHLP